MKGIHKKYREIPDGLFATINYPRSMALLTGIAGIQQDKTGNIIALGSDGVVYKIGIAKENGKNLDVIDVYEKKQENWLLHYLLTNYGDKFST